jgi:hypothetical protein
MEYYIDALKHRVTLVVVVLKVTKAEVVEMGIRVTQAQPEVKAVKEAVVLKVVEVFKEDKVFKALKVLKVILDM